MQVFIKCRSLFSNLGIRRGQMIWCIILGNCNSLCRWWCVHRSCQAGTRRSESTPSFCSRTLDLMVSWTLHVLWLSWLLRNKMIWAILEGKLFRKWIMTAGVEQKWNRNRLKYFQMCLLMVVVFNFISELWCNKETHGPSKGVHSVYYRQTHRNMWFHLVSNLTLVYELLVNQSIGGWKSLWKLVVGLGREG